MIVPVSPRRARELGELLGPGLASRLDRLDILSRRVFAGRLPGERRSKKRGRSVEFDDFRPYAAGDDLRHVDWNVYARLDRLVVKLFREEEDLALHVVVDASASMDAGDPSKILVAQRVAMALVTIGLAKQNRVVLGVIGAPGRPAVQRLRPIRGRRNLPRAAGFLLERCRPPDEPSPDEPGPNAGSARAAAGPGPLTDALRQIGATREGKGVMVVISDFLTDEAPGRALNYLSAGQRGLGWDTTCIRVLTPGERDPRREPGGLLAGDLALTDAESGRTAEVTLSPALLRRYRDRLARHEEQLRAACLARRIGYLGIGTDADLDRLIVETLRRRGLVG